MVPNHARPSQKQLLGSVGTPGSSSWTHLPSEARREDLLLAQCASALLPGFSLQPMWLVWELDRRRPPDAVFPRRPTDAALVLKALAADSGAFETLVERHQKKAHALARAVGLRGSVVDDVVQEAFLAAFRGLSSLLEPASFGPWLIGIVRNVARKELHLQARDEHVPFEQTHERPTADSVDRLELRELRDLVWGKVHELPEVIREAVYLYYHEGESVGEVARALGVSRSAVKSRLQRGRSLLRDELWRELRQSLRDMLPSTRDWTRRGRRMTLLIVAALAPASPGLRARCSTVPSWTIALSGVLALSAKKVIAVLVAVLVLAGGSVAILLVDSHKQDLAARESSSRLRPELPEAINALPEVGNSTSAPATVAEAVREDRILLELRDSRTDELVDPTLAVAQVEPAGAAEMTPRGDVLSIAFSPDAESATMSLSVKGYLPEVLDFTPSEVNDEPVVVFLDPGLSISGRVIEQATGEPVADAIVTALRLASDNESMKDLDKDPIDDGTTDSAGDFEVRGIDPHARVILRVESEGHALLYKEVPLPTAEDVHGLMLELDAGFAIRGIVKATRPELEELLTSAKVTLEATRSRGGRDLFANEREIEVARNAESDDPLTFEFHGLRESDYVLNAVPADEGLSIDNWTEPVHVDANQPIVETEILVARSETLRGTLVTTDGTPCPRALASISNLTGAGALTGPDGAFELRRLREGKQYTLSTMVPGSPGRDFAVERNPDVYVVHVATRRFRFHVTAGGEDISSKPIKFCQFDHPENPERRSNGQFIPATHEMASDGFRKMMLYKASLTHPLAPEIIDLESVTGSEIAVDLKEGVSLKGRLVTPEGKPIQNAVVMARLGVLEAGWWKDRTGGDGAFELKGLPLDPTLLKLSVSEAGDFQPVSELTVDSYEAPATFVLQRKAFEAAAGSAEAGQK